MTYEELRERLMSYPNVDPGTGATAEAVDRAQEVLGVSFAESYRRFLMDFGWVEIGPFEVYGLGAGIPEYLDVVKQTLWERIEARYHLPRHLIPIMNSGGGDQYCLDTSQPEDGESPVVLFDHELGSEQEPSRVGDTFSLWLANNVLSML